MKKYQLYCPSSNGYHVFRSNLKKLGEPDWIVGEKKLLSDFQSKFESTNKEVILQLVIGLNKHYRTRISDETLKEIANFILQPDFNEKLKSDNHDLVDKMRYGHNKEKKNGKTVDYLSFASKYCHHCYPDKYPIYDSINMHVMNGLTPL